MEERDKKQKLKQYVRVDNKELNTIQSENKDRYIERDRERDIDVDTDVVRDENKDRVNTNRYEREAKKEKKRKVKGKKNGCIIAVFLFFAALVVLGFIGAYFIVSSLDDIGADVNRNIEEEYEGDKFEAVIERFESDEFDEKTDADSYNYLALSFLEVERYEEAYEALEKGFQLADTTDIDLMTALYNNMCWSLNGLEKYEEAKEVGKKGLELGDVSTYIYTNYGNSLFSLGEYEEAIEAYLGSVYSVEGHSDYVNSSLGECYYQLGDYNNAIKWFQKYNELYPDEVQSLYDLAWSKAVYEDDYLAGYKHIERILEVGEDISESIQIKAEYLNYFEMYEENISFLEGYSEDIIYGNPYISYELMRSYSFTERNEEGIILGEALVKQGTKELDIWYGLLDLYYNIGDDIKAKKLIEKYIANNSQTYDMLREVASMYSYNFYYDNTEMILEDIVYGKVDIEITNDQWEDTLYEWLYTLDELDDYDRIIEVCKEYVDISQTINIYHFMAEAYYEIGETKVAIDNYIKAIEDDPEGIYVYEDLISVYYFEGEYKMAFKYLEEAISKGLEEETATELWELIEYTINVKPGKQLFDYIRENYMSFQETVEFNKLESEMIIKESLTNADYEKISSIVFGEDIFSYIVYPDEFDYFMELEEEESVSYEWLNSKDLLVRIDFFSAMTDVEILRMFDTIEDTTGTNLIIDLRYNYGGDTDSAYNLLDYLLPNTYLGDWESPIGESYSYYSDGRQYEFNSVTILVDDETASSAEILALGLKELLENTTIIGETTYGKGVGQLGMSHMDHKFGLYVVNAYWTINFININGIGIVPDIELIDGSLDEYIRVAKTNW